MRDAAEHDIDDSEIMHYGQKRVVWRTLVLGSVWYQVGSDWTPKLLPCLGLGSLCA